jgi:hypothetical protein
MAGLRKWLDREDRDREAALRDCARRPQTDGAHMGPATAPGFGVAALLSLPVEDQVRKEWDPRKGGLPTF